MKKLVVFSLLFFVSFFAGAKGNKDREIIELLKQLKAHYSKIDTLYASFRQVKKSPLLRKPAVTYGKFYFKKPDKLLLRFTDPYDIGIFYKKNRIYRFDFKNKRYAVLNIRRHKENALNFLNIPKAFYFLSKYFVIKKIDTKGKDLYLIFFPRKRRVRKRFKLVEMWLDRKTLLIKKLHFEEKNGNITTIILSDVKINSLIKDSIFRFSKKGFSKEKWQ